MPLTDREARNRYQRITMRRRRLLARVGEKYKDLANEYGHVAVEPVVNFRLWGSHYVPGERTSLPWRWAALLAEATLVDVPGLLPGTHDTEEAASPSTLDELKLAMAAITADIHAMTRSSRKRR